MTKSDKPTWDDAALAIFHILGDRPVAYHPELARALGGDVKAALILGQLMYWTGKGTFDPDWIRKSQSEFEEETALTRYEQERARKKLRSLGIIKEKLKGVPARLWFKVNYARLTEVLIAHMNGTSTQCGKAATKDAEKPQTEEEEAATKDAEKPQTISETSSETSSETTSETSAAEAAPSVLDEAFPESSAVEKGESLILEGDLTGLSQEEREQMAGPTSAPAAPGTGWDKVKVRWQEYNRKIIFPHNLNWHDIYDYALLFSELFGIPLPMDKNGISKWRVGAIQSISPFAEAIEQAGETVYPSVLIRRARWGLQVLHARRDRGDAYNFDIVAPNSTANTLRVIAGDLAKILELFVLNGADLPTGEMILEYYARQPGGNGRRPGSDVTGDAVAELEAMGA